MASDMDVLIDSLDIDSADVVRWSDGAIIGLKLAFDFPGKVAKLVGGGFNFVPESTALPDDMVEDTWGTSFAGLDSAAQQDVVGHASSRNAPT